MELIFKILSTLAATMTIENSKYLQAWPLLLRNFWSLSVWLDNVENNRDSVLIGLPNSSYICVSSECFD